MGGPQGGGRPDYFRRLVGGQNPRILLIGCSDSRGPAEQILGCGPGELFVHRNVANVVAYNDVNIASVIQYAIEYLKVDDVVVCGHYDCGGVAAPGARRRPGRRLRRELADDLLLGGQQDRRAAGPWRLTPSRASTSGWWSRRTSGSR